jgi:mannitol/fructose-specific phosphotransferase system IIA component (Ntr-type)
MEKHGSDRLGYPVIDLPESIGFSPEQVIRYMVEQLVGQGRISPKHANRAACQIITRESQGATAIGGGAALPHSKSEVPGVVGLIGRSRVPLPWQPQDGVTVREVCLLLLPVDQPSSSLQALQEAVAALSDRGSGRG